MCSESFPSQNSPTDSTDEANFVFATRALITAHRDSSSFSKLPKNWATSGKDINDSWKATERGLRVVVAFVRDELGWTTRRWLPSANALIPLGYLLRDRPNGFAANERSDVRRYLFITGIRGTISRFCRINDQFLHQSSQEGCGQAPASRVDCKENPERPPATDQGG